MQLLILALKIISIPLIIIIGESHFEEKTKNIALLLLAFLFNNLLGFVTCFSIFLISALSDSYLFILMIILIGFSLLVYLITINMYVKGKTDINTGIYIILNIISFLKGLFLR